jgi:hypothetical protein
MKNMFKLFIAVFVTGFLVGCGGGGGENDNGDNSGQTPVAPSISFADLESKFSKFPSGTANIYGAIKMKQYNISKNAFDDFNASVLALNSYNFDAPNNSYSREDSGTQIIYFAQHNNTAHTLEVSIQQINSVLSELNDSTFDSEFDNINGNLTRALLLVYYDDDISSKYASYAINLYTYNNFECKKGASTNNKYKCVKEDDKFVYIWQENDEYSFYYGAIVK